jgi:hypothetical protein
MSTSLQALYHMRKKSCPMAAGQENAEQESNWRGAEISTLVSSAIGSVVGWTSQLFGRNFLNRRLSAESSASPRKFPTVGQGCCKPVGSSHGLCSGK